MKEINVDSEILEICREIKSRDLTADDWAQIESSDMFQSTHFCGGYESTEGEFTFSFYDENSTEYWFNLSLEEVDQILNNKIITLKLRTPE